MQKWAMCMKSSVVAFDGVVDKTSDQRVVMCDVADQQGLGERVRVGAMIEKPLRVIPAATTISSIDVDLNPFCSTARSAASRIRSRVCFPLAGTRSEEHTSELRSLMSVSYDFLCLTQK